MHTSFLHAFVELYIFVTVRYLSSVYKWSVMKKSVFNIRTGTLLAALMVCFSLQGQQPEGMVKYTPDFRFTDGIYMNFDQVKLNSPIPKAKLLTSADYNDKDFFKKVFESDKIYYYDALGVRQEVDKSAIWGYARNGVLYVQIQSNFNRITFIGNICHFVADVTTMDPGYYNSPYGYYDPYSYYSPYGYGNYYSPYGGYYNPYYGSPYGRNNYARSEIKQYLIDFESGKTLEFDLNSTELLLMKDDQLYEEFVRLPRKNKKELMFVYIRKYNEKHPLYIPANNN
jgi:hypothetical protein